MDQGNGVKKRCINLLTRLMKINYLLFILLFHSPSLLPAGEKLYNITEPLPIPRQMYGTTILGNYLYVIGGNIQGKGDDPEGYVLTVEKAYINPDGTLQKWTQTTPLPANRSYIHNSTLALNDIVYVVMGIDGQKTLATKTIFWTKPRTDGHLEPWRESPPYPGPGIKLSTAVATPGYIHILGGKDLNNAPINEVWCAMVGTDGAITGWEKGAPLPISLYFHCSAIAGGRVWVWGGLKDNNITLNKQIFSAQVLSSGKIGPWVLCPTTLKMPFYNAAVTVSGPYLLSFGPHYAPELFGNDIWFASVQPDGLSEWQKIPNDISPKLYIGVATDYRRGFVYIPGGRINRDEDERSLDKNVYYLKLAASSQEDVQNESTMPDLKYGPASGNAQLSYIQQNLKTSSSFPGFFPYEQGRQMAQSQLKPLVLYFYTQQATQCIQQDQILQDYNAARYQGKVIFAEVNTLDFPQISQQYGVFWVPCWIFFDSNGTIKFRDRGILPGQKLDQYIRTIAP